MKIFVDKNGQTIVSDFSPPKKNEHVWANIGYLRTGKTDFFFSNRSHSNFHGIGQKIDKIGPTGPKLSAELKSNFHLKLAISSVLDSHIDLSKWFIHVSRP